jgi:hypothetical protein
MVEDISEGLMALVINVGDKANAKSTYSIGKCYN